jgi:uncharacterized protein YcfJ
METTVTSTPNRIHPMMMVAAASVTLVSLLGVAAITGILPSSHGTVAPAPVSASVGLADASNVNGSPARYVTADGKVLEVVPQQGQATPVTQVNYANAPAYAPAPVIHHRPVHHYSQQYAQNMSSQPVSTYQQPYSAPQQHPVVNYINDMHPVGTGVGAVVGGLLGNQVGGGNGKKLATVAGVLMGGYAGNEIAHNRSPLPGQ